MRISKSLRAFGILALIAPLVSHSEHQPPMQF